MSETVNLDKKESHVIGDSVKRDYFIQDHNFEKLKAVSESVYDKTHVKPSIRKLVNLIIEEAETDKIRDQLIGIYQ